MKAKYYPDPDLSRYSPLTVAKENADGTVDLVDAKGVPIVTSCPVVKEPTLGHCVLEDEAPKEVKAKEPKK